MLFTQESDPPSQGRDFEVAPGREGADRSGVTNSEAHVEPFSSPDRLTLTRFSSTLLEMFSRRTLKILAIAILACQLASLSSWHTAHLEDLFSSGTAKAQVSTHADADHCKHLPLSEHTQCGICTSIHGRMSLEPVSDKLGLLQVVGYFVAVGSTCSTQLFPLDSFYRRGLPIFSVRSFVTY